MSKIALCVMVGKVAWMQSEDDWNRMISSSSPFVDEVFVAYNGSPAPGVLDFDAKSKAPACTVESFEWEDDFAAMRNKNFAMVPDDFDWILWLDSDDELIDGHRLRELVESIPDDVSQVLLPYQYAFNHKTGSNHTDQYRERLFRRDSGGRWVGMIHERFLLSPGTGNQRSELVSVKHWRDLIDGDNEESRERNRRILAKAIKLHPNDERYCFYHAHEMLAQARQHMKDGKNEDAAKVFQVAYTLYETYLKQFAGEPGDNPYFANCCMGECLRVLGQWGDAINRDLQGVKMRPKYPDSYIGIAQSFAAYDQWEQAGDWAELAMHVSENLERSTIVDRLSLEYTPYHIRGFAREHQGDYKGAIEDLERAHKADPEINDLLPIIHKLKKKLLYQGWTSNIRKETYGSKVEKSIAFLTAPHYEKWDPAVAAKGGIGGAERCVIEIAKRFAEDGYRSVVFGTPETECVYDDVEYWDVRHQYNPAEKFGTVVSSRVPAFFDSPKRHKETRVLWMHDVNAGPMEHEGRLLNEADIVVGLSNWHCNHLMKVYPALKIENVTRISNGINVEDWIVAPQQRDPFKFVYASSPDRGLDVLLSLWPAIKHEFPEANLDVFYGWTGMDKILARSPGHPIGRFKEYIVGMVEELNTDGSIRWNDRVSHQVLRDSYATTNIWTYPAYFCETFCITALEMQAAGVIPLTSSLGALTEIVPDYLTVSGYPNNQDYKKRYLVSLRNVLSRREWVKEEMRAEGVSFAKKFSWDNSYMEWKKALGIESKVKSYSLSR